MHPLLPLPKPKKIEFKPPKYPPNEKIYPSPAEQQQRMGSKIDRLLTALDNQTIKISDNTNWLLQEKVLVLESKSSAGDLQNAIKQIPSLEWMLEFTDEDATESDLFYEQNKEGEKVKNLKTSYFYLTMTDVEGLHQIKRLWDDYQKDKRAKSKLGPFKELFKFLTGIRFWDESDRVRDTGLAEDLSERLAHDEEEMNVEIELWHSESKEKRGLREQYVNQQIIQSDGLILSSSSLPEIKYHAILVKFPIAAVQSFIDNVSPQSIVRVDSVMYIRPQSTANINDSFTPVLETNEEDVIREDIPQYIANEIDVALLDGLPLENHEALRGKVIIHDPDDFASTYRPAHRVHGTSMASIIVNGDHSYDEVPLKRPILSRPLLKPKEVAFGKFMEQFPDNVLFIDLVHRAVVSLFKGESNLDAIAPEVKVINFSLGDIKRLFDTRVSPLAMLIDWLSYKYKVLFIISCGNYMDDLDLGLKIDEFNAQTILKQAKTFVKAVEKNSINKRLLSPAESINSLTVGSYNQDGCKADSYLLQGRLNPLNSDFPSSYNSASLGHKKAIKPEILMPGGVMLYRLSNGYFDSGSVKLKAQHMSLKPPYVEPGVKSAYPGKPGSTNSYSYSFGSSNATALATRKAAMVCELVRELNNSGDHQMDESSMSNIVKALLVHGADARNIKKNLFTSNNKRDISRFTGHGIVNESRIVGCHDNEATLITTGKIKIGEHLLYQVPIPETFRLNPSEKRIIITLSWFSPTNPNSQKYRGVQLRLVSGKDIADMMKMKREQAAGQVVHGTTHHEVYISKKAPLLFEDNPEVPIHISAHNDALKMPDEYEINYALVVTIDAPDSDQQVYSQVRERLRSVLKQKI